MSSITKIVKYKLKFIDGVGYQPYLDLARLKCSFEGGHFNHGNGYFIGYITGEPQDLENAFEECETDFKLTEITEQEACIIADLLQTPGTQNEYGQYIQPATIVDGKISKLTTLTAPENPEINLIWYYKKLKLEEILAEEKQEQDSGYYCSNSIKLQVRDQDLINWNQLMTGIIAFQPEYVNIRDFDNVTHTLPLATVSAMLAEVFVFGQTCFGKTWAAKDALINATTISQVNAITRG